MTVDTETLRSRIRAVVTSAHATLLDLDALAEDLGDPEHGPPEPVTIDSAAAEARLALFAELVAILTAVPSSPQWVSVLSTFQRRHAAVTLDALPIEDLESLVNQARYLARSRGQKV